MNSVTPNRPRCAFVAASGGLLLSALLSGCSVTTAPCLQYTPQNLTRTVTLRGHGMVEVTEQTLICSQRAQIRIASVD